jgi:hypothetical protein
MEFSVFSNWITKLNFSKTSVFMRSLHPVHEVNSQENGHVCLNRFISEKYYLVLN